MKKATHPWMKWLLRVVVPFVREPEDFSQPGGATGSRCKTLD